MLTSSVERHGSAWYSNFLDSGKSSVRHTMEDPWHSYVVVGDAFQGDGGRVLVCLYGDMFSQENRREYRNLAISSGAERSPVQDQPVLLARRGFVPSLHGAIQKGGAWREPSADDVEPAFPVANEQGVLQVLSMENHDASSIPG